MLFSLHHEQQTHNQTLKQTNKKPGMLKRERRWMTHRTNMITNITMCIIGDHGHLASPSILMDTSHLLLSIFISLLEQPERGGRKRREGDEQACLMFAPPKALGEVAAQSGRRAGNVEKWRSIW
jgi:hypothetical protein